MKNNEHGVDIRSIAVGDRIRVTGCDDDKNKLDWGTVLTIDNRDPTEFFLDMDDYLLMEASRYSTPDGTSCYLAYPSEIHEHVPAKPREFSMDDFMKDFNALNPVEQETIRNILREMP